MTKGGNNIGGEIIRFPDPRKYDILQEYEEIEKEVGENAKNKHVPACLRRFIHQSRVFK